MKISIRLLLLFLLGNITTTFSQDTKQQIENNRKVNYYLIEAKEALSHGNVQQAISLYNQCIIIDKSCATAHYELSNIAIAVNDTEIALKHSRAAVSLAPENTWYLLQLAEIMEARGMLVQAAEAYKKLANLESANPYYLQKSVMLYETSESWEEALKTYEIIEQKYGYDFNILVRKQAIYSKSGKKKEAYSELRKLLKKEPKNSEYYSLLAMRYQEDGENKKAEKTFLKLASLDSISGIAKMVLSRHYMQKKDYPKAYKAIKGALESKTVDENVNVAAVIGLLQADTTEQAKNYTDTLSSLLIKQYPENAIGYLFRARRLGAEKKYDEAEKVLEKALDLDPSNYNGLAQLCFTQNIKEHWDALYTTSQKGIKFYPQEHLFYIFKGLAASHKKEYAVAEATLTTGYLYAKEEAAQQDIQGLLADTYYKRGKIEKAFDLYEELLAKKPDNLGILNNYSYFLSLEKQQLEKAEAMSRKTIEKEPKNSTYLDTYAWIMYQMGAYPKALEYINKAIENLEDEASSEMWEHYGDILFKLGEKKQAKKEWMKALHLSKPDTKRLKEKIADNE